MDAIETVRRRAIEQRMDKRRAEVERDMAEKIKNARRVSLTEIAKVPDRQKRLEDALQAVLELMEVGFAPALRLLPDYLKGDVQARYEAAKDAIEELKREEA